MLETLKMDLRTYIFLKRMTVKGFAESIDYSANQISAIIHARRKPGKKLAKAIEKATDGEVTAVELLKDKTEGE